MPQIRKMMAQPSLRQRTRNSTLFLPPWTSSKEAIIKLFLLRYAPCQSQSPGACRTLWSWGLRISNGDKMSPCQTRQLFIQDCQDSFRLPITDNGAVKSPMVLCKVPLSSPAPFLHPHRPANTRNSSEKWIRRASWTCRRNPQTIFRRRNQLEAQQRYDCYTLLSAVKTPSPHQKLTNRAGASHI